VLEVQRGELVGLTQRRQPLVVELEADAIGALGFNDLAHQIGRLTRDMRSADNEDGPAVEADRVDVAQKDTLSSARVGTVTRGSRSHKSGVEVHKAGNHNGRPP
jgi:hypothetical protein